MSEDDVRVAPAPIPLTRPELQTCAATGKVEFRSPEEARRVCREIRQRNDDRVHPCEHCRRWHVGHADSDKKQ